MSKIVQLQEEIEGIRSNLSSLERALERGCQITCSVYNNIFVGRIFSEEAKELVYAGFRMEIARLEGDHRPVVQVPIYNPMTLKELKELIQYEVDSCWDFYSELDGDALDAAIEAIELRDGLDPEEHLLFSELEFPEEDEEEHWHFCYAFFVVEVKDV